MEAWGVEVGAGEGAGEGAGAGVGEGAGEKQYNLTASKLDVMTDGVGEM